MKKKIYIIILLGVNFMEKTISIQGTEITFSIWDLGGILLIKKKNNHYK